MSIYTYTGQFLDHKPTKLNEKKPFGSFKLRAANC